MIQLNNLSIGYPKKTIATGLNARLQAGKLTCLVGRNGVGKSTLLRTLAGFQSPLSGQLIINGKDITDVSKKQLSTMISVVLTGRPSVQQITVREIVGMGRSPYTDMWGSLRAEDVAIVNESIEMVGIEMLADRRLDTLSDGESQKVMIAKALAQQTPTILLDEPTAFLDYPSKAETMRLMKRIAGADDTPRAALLSTHDMEMSLRLADEIWLMTSDHRLLCGTPSELEEELIKENLKIQF